MPSMLVTGGAGFMGSNFVRHVLNHTDAVVTVLDRLSYSANRASLQGLPADRLRLIVGDVVDSADLDRLVAECDTVVHFAAESHNDRALVDPTPFLHTNVMGTFSLLEAVRRHGVRLHHISTDEVFGDTTLDDTTLFTEHSPYAPSSPYAATKAASDLLVRAWVRSYDVRATISNCSNAYGPYQHVEKFIPRQITNVLRGRRPRLFGDGRNVRDWIHVDDHSSAVLRIIDAGRIGHTYLVGASEQRDNRTIVETILRLMGRPGDEYDRVADRAGHDVRYAVDSTALQSELGWRPAHADMDAALASVIDWYRTHESWWDAAKADAERFYAQTGQ